MSEQINKNRNINEGDHSVREREICDKLFCFKLTTESPFHILKLQRQQAKIMALGVSKRK